MRAPLLAPCASRIVGIGQTGFHLLSPMGTTSVVAARIDFKVTRVRCEETFLVSKLKESCSVGPTQAARDYGSEPSLNGHRLDWRARRDGTGRDGRDRHGITPGRPGH
jgi:hypothetical protein